MHKAHSTLLPCTTAHIAALPRAGRKFVEGDLRTDHRPRGTEPRAGVGEINRWPRGRRPAQGQADPRRAGV